ncbi:hypothetical protein MMC25_000054 [Agyrium rufum]|nr:hypothetical protein [Agyrium rufum]
MDTIAPVEQGPIIIPTSHWQTMIPYFKMGTPIFAIMIAIAVWAAIMGNIFDGNDKPKGKARELTGPSGISFDASKNIKRVSVSNDPKFIKERRASAGK